MDKVTSRQRVIILGIFAVLVVAAGAIWITMRTTNIQATPVLTVTTQNAVNVAPTSATLSGSLVSLGNNPYVNVYFQWGTTPGSYANQTSPTTMGTTGRVQAKISGLTSGNTYYFRVVAAGSNTTNGAEMKVSTP